LEHLDESRGRHSGIGQQLQQHLGIQQRIAGNEDPFAIADEPVLPLACSIRPPTGEDQRVGALVTGDGRD
jgi:hypothetical protein